jgi:hypothetical protein
MKNERTSHRKAFGSVTHLIINSIINKEAWTEVNVAYALRWWSNVLRIRSDPNIYGRILIRILVVTDDLILTFLLLINAKNIVEIYAIKLFASLTSFVEQISAKKTFPRKVDENFI